MQIVIYLGNQSCQLCDCDGLRTEHRSILNTIGGVLLDDVPTVRIHLEIEMVGFTRWFDRHDYISGLGLGLQ